MKEIGRPLTSASETPFHVLERARGLFLECRRAIDHDDLRSADAPGKGGDIAWALTCITRTEPFFRLAVRDKGHLAGDFVVAPDCAAQRLQLTGSAGDFPGSQDFTLGKLSLTRVVGR